MEIAGVSLGLAFVGGLVSFISPCVLPLAPVYVANLAGVAVQTSSSRWRTVHTFWHALLFVLGFGSVFVLLGALIGWLGLGIREHVVLASRIAGGFVIVFGLHMTGLLRIPLLNRTLKPDLDPNTRLGFGRSWLLGSGFALGWTPCVGPTLGTILSLGLNTGQVAESSFLLAIYSLGLGIPFLMLGLAVGPTTRLLKKLNRYMHPIELASGGLLIVAGVLLVTNTLTRFNSFFQSGLGSQI